LILAFSFVPTVVSSCSYSYNYPGLTYIMTSTLTPVKKSYLCTGAQCTSLGREIYKGMCASCFDKAAKTMTNAPSVATAVATAVAMTASISAPSAISIEPKPAVVTPSSDLKQELKSIKKRRDHQKKKKQVSIDAKPDIKQQEPEYDTLDASSSDTSDEETDTKKETGKEKEKEKEGPGKEADKKQSAALLTISATPETAVTTVVAEEKKEKVRVRIVYEYSVQCFTKTVKFTVYLDRYGTSHLVQLPWDSDLSKWALVFPNGRDFKPHYALEFVFSSKMAERIEMIRFEAKESKDATPNKMAGAIARFGQMVYDTDKSMYYLKANAVWDDVPLEIGNTTKKVKDIRGMKLYEMKTKREERRTKWAAALCMLCCLFIFGVCGYQDHQTHLKAVRAAAEARNKASQPVCQRQSRGSQILKNIGTIDTQFLVAIQLFFGKRPRQ